MSSNSTKFRKGNPFKFHHKTRESKVGESTDQALPDVVGVNARQTDGH